jgi:homoserine O-succinyltransferase
MPVTIPDGLPAVKTLTGENIFVMTGTRATTQDIRPLRIAILNLMPTKTDTETQLLRLLGNTPLQVEPTLLHTASYKSRNTESSYLKAFYRTFPEIRDRKFDGLIVTGAPVETKAFEEVLYWKELQEILEWAKKNVFASLFICWGAQAALHYYYGLEKRNVGDKVFGVFPHRVLRPNHRLLRGFDDLFLAPHSRYTTIEEQDVQSIGDLQVLAVSDEAGLYLAASNDGRRVFVTGHSEYDRMTLDKEYRRDVAQGLDTPVPRNYYPGDDPTKEPTVSWKAHANLLFSNWLNYFVYQETPYLIDTLSS